MSFITAAIVGGVASIGGSLIAANQQKQGAKGAAALQERMFNTINNQNKPFMDAGYGATQRMSELLGTGGDPNAAGYGEYSKPFTMGDFLAFKDPGYEFELQQGTQALQNSAAAGSGALSGAALKDLLGYSQGFARTGYTDAFNRYQVQQDNIFKRLAGVSELGQASASNVGANGTALAGNAGQALTTAGGAAGAGIAGATNAASNLGTNLWLANMLKPPQAG
jgi:hypothetical protein